MSVLEVLRGERAWWIETADVLDGLKAMPSESVHCVVTSPPYWGLRDYGTARWEGGDPDCSHKVRPEGSGMNSVGIDGGRHTQGHQQEGYREVCRRCGARRIDRQIGLEATPAEFVATMVEVLREVRRVLRKDGTLWLNLGDSYATSPPGNTKTGTEKWKTSGLHGSVSATYAKTLDASVSTKRNTVAGGLKPKDLAGIPWRVAFGLQDDGWWLRSAITWCKRACMPESVTDRPTTATEMIFLLTKAERYFYDAEAVREENEGSLPWGRGDVEARKHSQPEGHGAGRLGKTSMLNSASYEQELAYRTNGRNMRNFWLLGPEPYPDAHFATFPTEVPRRCVVAGTSMAGCCAECGAPWRRVKTPTSTYARHLGKDWADYAQDAAEGRGHAVSGQRPTKRNGASVSAEYLTTGWEPTCKHAAEVLPCVVLDIFNGAGTTGLVARRLGRRYIGLELNPAYAEMARKRIVADQGIDPKHAAEVNGTAQLRLLDGVA